MFARYRQKEITVRNTTLTLIAQPETPNLKAILEVLVTTGGRQVVVVIDQKQADQLIGWLACFVETGNLPT